MNLFVALSGNEAAGNSEAFTIMINGIASTLTCTVATGASTCSDTTDTVTFTAGQTVNIRMVRGGAANALTGSGAFRPRRSSSRANWCDWTNWPDGTNWF